MSVARVTQHLLLTLITTNDDIAAVLLVIEYVVVLGVAGQCQLCRPLHSTASLHLAHLGRGYKTVSFLQGPLLRYLL